MVLVFTDDRELAMVYATALGGVMLDKTSIRLKSLPTHKALLAQKMEEDGYLSTFFRGTQYVFISVPYEEIALNRMQDYDACYAKVADRPIPFIPSEFGLRVAHPPLAHDEMYAALCDRATCVVNAAKDDLAGMLAFSHFANMYQIKRTFTRARPVILTEERILEAFNSQEDHSNYGTVAAACKMQERINWLVNCNVSNLFMQMNPGVVLATGRIEALILDQLAAGIKERSEKAHVTIKCGKERFDCRLSPPPTVKMRAKALVETIKNGPPELTASFDYTMEPADTNGSFYNVFSLLIDTARISLQPLDKVWSAILSLFYDGYISWPASSTGLPWTVKPALTAAVTRLSADTRFSDRVMPGDVDKFKYWDKSQDITGGIGIILSGKDASSLSGIQETAYRLVGERIIQAIKYERMHESIALTGTVNGYPFSFKKTRDRFITDTGELLPPSDGHEWPEEVDAKTAKVDEIAVVPPLPYYDYELLSDILPLFRQAFRYGLPFLLTPLENLSIWGHCVKGPDGAMTLTEKGEWLLRQVRGTPLLNPDSTVVWDEQAMEVARGVLNAAQCCMQYVPDYIKDLTDCIRSAAELINETGGIPLSECVCPVCGGSVVWQDKGNCWHCERETCAFSIPAAVREHPLTVKDMAQLLSRGYTDLYFDFKGRNGSSYPARFVFDKDNKVVLSFKSTCRCPKCGEPMDEYLWGLACPDKKGCGYTASTLKCGVRLSEQDEIDLFSGKKTQLIRSFVSKSNKTFAASLYLADDFSIKFDFPKKEG